MHENHVGTDITRNWLISKGELDDMRKKNYVGTTVFWTSRFGDKNRGVVLREQPRTNGKYWFVQVDGGAVQLIAAHDFQEIHYPSW